MEFERIHKLLDKYWSCETTVSEEKELQDFFSGDRIPSDLQAYVPLFSYRHTRQNLVLNAGFDERLRAAMKKTRGGGEYVTIKIFRPLLRIAASVLLMGGLGVSLFFISKQNNKPQFAETYNDPDMALKHAAFALEKLSDALRTGEDASRKTLQNIDDINIDWSLLDSLSTPVSVAAGKEDMAEPKESL